MVTHLRATGAVGDHTSHPPQVNAHRPDLTSARQAGTRFTYHRRTKGWVDLGRWLHTEMVYLPADSQYV